MKLNPRNTSGVTGVHKHEQSGLWRAQICVGRRRYSLGVYRRIADAALARAAAEARLLQLAEARP